MAWFSKASPKPRASVTLADIPTWPVYAAKSKCSSRLVWFCLVSMLVLLEEGIVASAEIYVSMQKDYR